MFLPAAKTYDVQRSFPEIAGEVHVPEYEMVDPVCCGILPGIFDERFGKPGVESTSRTLTPGPFIGLIVALAGFAAPPVAELQRKIGMQAPRKNSFERSRTERTVQKFEHRLTVDVHIVAVGHEDLPSGKGQQPGRGIDLHAALAGKVVTDPHVVIARKEDHTDSPFGVQFGSGYRQAAQLKTLMASKSKAQQQDFSDICEKNNFTVNDFREQWIDFPEFLSYLPTLRSQNYDSVLSSTAVQEMRDSHSRYYFQIEAVMREGEPIPLERLRRNIRRILFNQRKGDIIRQHEEELLQRAEENGEVKIFGGKHNAPERVPMAGTNDENEAKR